MDSDFIKILFYVVLGIIYLISQIRKSRSKHLQPSEPREVETIPVPGESRPKEFESWRDRKTVNKPAETSQKPAPISLEDLLKEFAPELETPTPEPQKAPETTKFTREVVVDNKRELVDEEEEILRKKAQQREAGSTKQQPKKTVERAHPVKKHYENPYANKLKNPQDLKEAFLMSEILNRKFDI